MKGMTYILKNNSEEIRTQIEKAGINICPCAKFSDACWLDYVTSVSDRVHGVGYGSEELGLHSQEEVLNFFVSGCKNPYYCKDVDEFIAKIQESK